MSTPKKVEPPQIQLKTVKHLFTKEELLELGQQLAEHHERLVSVISEEKMVSKRYKSARAELESKIASASTDLKSGFQMRDENVVVIMFPKERVKRYWLQGDDPKKNKDGFVLQEPMLQSDYQQELLPEEIRFEKSETFDLFPKTDTDYGTMTVAFEPKQKLWRAAFSAKIGDKELREELTVKTPAAKKRPEAISRAATRFQKWIVKELGKDVAKGFDEPVSAAIEPHRERVE
jgi:hypothetical protein